MDPFFFQGLNDLDFGCNAGMIASRLPQRIIALHSFLTDHDILQRIIECMPHMKLSGDVWRRHNNGERFFTLVHFRMKIFFLEPAVIDHLLDLFWVVGFS